MDIRKFLKRETGQPSEETQCDPSNQSRRGAVKESPFFAKRYIKRSTESDDSIVLQDKVCELQSPSKKLCVQPGLVGLRASGPASMASMVEAPTSVFTLPPKFSTGCSQPPRTVPTLAPVTLSGASTAPLTGCSQGSSRQIKEYISEKAEVVPRGALPILSATTSRDLDKGKQRIKVDEVSRSHDSDLWTSKHRPQKMADLVGNGAQIQRLRGWLVNWDRLHNKPKSTGVASSSRGPGRAGGGGDEERKAALLFGGPGIGKTSSATIICKELGYQVMEVNASDSRGKSDKQVRSGMNGRTSNMVKELVTNRSLQGGKMGGQKTVLIMDEVDGMSGGDRGGVQELITIIQKSKVPIICICNDKYNQKLKSLVKHCMELAFAKPTKQQVARRLLGIAQIEGLRTDERSLEQLLESVQCDIRLAINHLQLLRKGQDSLNLAGVTQGMKGGMKDLELSPFTVADKLLSGGCHGMSVNDQINLVFQDADLVPLLIQENYLNFRPMGVRNDSSRLDRIVMAADAISAGDVVTCRIRRFQQWELMPLGCALGSVSSATYVRGGREALVQGERNFNRFTAWLGKSSTAGKSSRQLADVQMHLLASANCPTTRIDSSTSSTLDHHSGLRQGLGVGGWGFTGGGWGLGTRGAVRLDYFSMLAQALTSPLRTKGKDGVSEVVDMMEEYGLTKEDRDAILEMNTLKGMSDPQSSIPTLVRTAFTRQLNQQVAQRTVKASCMMPDARGGGGGGRSRGGGGGGGGAENDVVAADEGGSAVAVEEAGEEGGEGEDGEGEGGEVVIPGVKRKGGAGGRGGGGKAARGEGTAGGRGDGRGRGGGRGGRGGGGDGAWMEEMEMMTGKGRGRGRGRGKK